MEYIINTPCGPVQGVPGRVSGTVAFKGIRYATAGRWEYPQEVTAWEGTYDASHYGHCSYQPRAFYDEELNEKKYFYYNEFRKGETYTYSEDCLFLNIFVPENAKEGDKLPVLFYIHGGGFTGGCGHEKHFDGPVWPAHGVIGVTINYRLGPMGLLCLPELQEEAGHTGNYGLYDQMTAMQWVKHNIAAFGGDPENITIMGQSAGAASVQMQTQSPLTEGLFQKAVMSSGCGLGSMMACKLETAMAFWQEVMKRAGCENLEQFRALPVEKLFAVWLAAKKDVKGGNAATFPVMDGRFAVAGTPARNISYMAGSTSHDMAPPILLSMTRKWITQREKPSYTWFFDRMLPGDENGAWHSADLWYWFGTLENCWRPMEQKDRDLSNQMIDYLCNFAATGDPNRADLPTWIPSGKGSSRVLCLGEKPTRMAKPGMLKLIYTMLTNKAVGE
jgi:para-nitrobenzyl esterase